MEVERLRCDVAVIGAGPAGSTAALLLARRGLDVVLIEKERFPRDKVCGEFLSWDALPCLDLLGLGGFLDHSGSPRITICRLVGHSRSTEFELPDAARGISRWALDAALADAARSRGARLENASVDDLRKEGDGTFCLTLRRSGGSVIEIIARAVIGAWGRWGRLDRQLARPFASGRDRRSFGFKRHYRSNEQCDTIVLHSFRSGYLGVSPVEGGTLNVCGLVDEERISGMKGGWNSFAEQLRREAAPLDALFAPLEPLSDFISSEPVIFAGKAPVERGMLLIGDSSGIVDPLTGNGMAMAMQSAVLAATLIPERVAAPRNAEEIEHRYVAAHRRLFSSRIRWSRFVARLLSRPGLLDAAIRSLPPRLISRKLTEWTRADTAEIARLCAAV